MHETKDNRRDARCAQVTPGQLEACVDDVLPSAGSRG
jgi:hypothetical protein